MSHVLIIGNGPAAHRLVERLRHHGHGGPITVLGQEQCPAYNRVLLASVLDGTLSPGSVTLPESDAEVRLGVTATAIDPARRLVRTTTGVVHRYDELVLATGARATVPEIPGVRGAEGELAGGVTTLRTLDDCERVDATAQRAVVLGGGVLGVETARGLQGRGIDVTLVHPQPRLMDRQLDPAGGELLAEHLRGMGATTELCCRAAEYRPGALVLDDGRVLETEALVLCTGVQPETELARAAGLAAGRGVLVDDRMRTTDPHVYAIGDCAEHDGRVPGLIAPAWEQADALAQVLTGGNGRYRSVGSVTRLKVRGIDLSAIGSATCLDGSETDVELVTMADPARGRYAKLALRQERVAGAVLIGFPQAGAAISQLHDRDLPVPADRLGLLLGGSAPERSAPTELADDAVICRCNNVTKQRLERAFRDGARDAGALARATRATTGCGGCGDDVRRLCDALHDTSIEQEGAA